ncbi:MAG TPA: Uma2 family endonuclease [Tepidisphaeraceae bacterium]|nr:Uma2 family endonuclease [Tepidisphaeraceae bacterium]
MGIALTNPPLPLSDDAGDMLLYRYSVDQYHELIEAGTIEEGAPYELLDGVVVRKVRSATGENPMTVNPDHVWSVRQLDKLDAKLLRAGCHMRTQSPLTLAPHHEPEPDGLIVRGSPDEFLDRHPRSADALCVVEVADASLRTDRGRKQRIYATAGIPVYVILNLPDRVAEVYSDPNAGTGRYGRSETLLPNDKLALPTVRGAKLTVTVKSLLPKSATPRRPSSGTSPPATRSPSPS